MFGTSNLGFWNAPLTCLTDFAVDWRQRSPLSTGIRFLHITDGLLLLTSQNLRTFHPLQTITSLKSCQTSRRLSHMTGCRPMRWVMSWAAVNPSDFVCGSRTGLKAETTLVVVISKTFTTAPWTSWTSWTSWTLSLCIGLGCLGCLGSIVHHHCSPRKTMYWL